MARAYHSDRDRVCEGAARRGTASAIGVVILLFGASSAFGELQSRLNKVWEAQVSLRLPVPLRRRTDREVEKPTAGTSDLKTQR